MKNNIFFLALLTHLIVCLANAEVSDWSKEFDFDGSEITETKAITIAPDDKLAYSYSLVSGNPISIRIDVVDNNKPKKKAKLFFDKTKTLVQGTISWNYKDKAYKSFPLDDPYVLKETITTDSETKIYTRHVHLLPEPSVIIVLFVFGFLLFSKGKNKFLFVFTLSFITCLGLQAKSSISNVQCMQMWPFDRSVIINYTINSDEADTFDIKFYGTTNNGETVFNLSECGNLLKDGADGKVTGLGTHEVIWIPNDSFFSQKKSKMQVRIEIEKDVTYMLVNLSNGSVFYTGREPEGGWDDPRDSYKRGIMVLRLIKPGKFLMGSPENELGRWGNEDQHEVTLTKPYYIGVFEVTQEQYGSSSSVYKRYLHPVESVNYYLLRGFESQNPQRDPSGNSFLARLREKTKLNFDLPTEAQWEYACRAGTTTALNNGTNLQDPDKDSNLDKLGCYYYNNHGTHNKVGSYLPNAWGLYDMHGNVYELCKDRYTTHLGNDPVTDPLFYKQGDKASGCYVMRGGCWDRDGGDFNFASRCRSARRMYFDTDHNYPYASTVGCRLVLNWPYFLKD